MGLQSRSETARLLISLKVMEENIKLVFVLAYIGRHILSTCFGKKLTACLAVRLIGLWFVIAS